MTEPSVAEAILDVMEAFQYAFQPEGSVVPYTEKLSALIERIEAAEQVRETAEAALDELKATVQSVVEQGLVDFPGIEILGEALEARSD